MLNEMITDINVCKYIYVVWKFITYLFDKIEN